MAKHRSYSVEFKRQVAQEYIAGETLHGLAKRHDLSRNLIRIWVAKHEAGAFDDDARAADLLQEYEAKIAALERMVGRQAGRTSFFRHWRAGRRAPGARRAHVVSPLTSWRPARTTVERPVAKPDSGPAAGGG